MSEPKIVRLFHYGDSQTVRLRAEFRFEGDEGYVRRDDQTGDVILSPRPRLRTWQAFMYRLGPEDP